MAATENPYPIEINQTYFLNPMLLKTSATIAIIQNKFM